ncbi:A/B superfamily hydrolase [Rhodotorula taiwanensis]|uniref:A/B superfamily hydrolase n=1 Tax=Rhodotorula taiwanensis TaxID=741276 RepID=A0A2S5BID8_9BASI|nr:A/B superfamily hydrolase [Rhodotorula taiwanensis]
MEHVEDLTGPQGTRFFTKHWTPDSATPVRAAVFFIERVERYDHVFPKYAQQGIAVFAFDQRGFGKTATYGEKNTHGQTSWPEQFADIDFFLSHVLKHYPNVPVYLYGHSMGGALVLQYCCRSTTYANVNRLTGAISSSPLLRQAKGVRAPSWMVKAGSLVGKLSATLPIKATVNPEHTCRDPQVQKEYANDPLCKQVGTFRGVGDMLVGGQQTVDRDYVRFPHSLPLLVVHGEGDLVTDCESSEEFAEKVRKEGAKDVTFKSFPGFFHEMHNEPGEDKWTEINYILGWLTSHVSTTGSAPTPTAVTPAAGTVSVEVPTATATAAIPEPAREPIRDSKL